MESQIVNKKKKRLMILIWDMGLGGIQKRVKDLVIDMGNNYPEWEVYLLIKLKKKGFYLDEIKSQTKVKINYFYFTGRYGRSKSLYALFWIIKSYIRIEPDVYLTFLDHLSIIMVIIKKLVFWHSTKLVLNEGILTSKYIKVHRRKKWLWRFLVKSTYKHADRIIVPTKACRSDLTVNFSVPKMKVKVIPNWTLFKVKKPSKKIYDLIFIGRIAKEKKPMSLVNIIEKLKRKHPKIKLCVLGSGKLEKKFSDAIKTKGLSKNINLFGYRKDVASFLIKSKLLILPTVNEGMPNVVLEAAMCRVPAITNQFKGSEELIQNGRTGYIVKSEKEMVEAIPKLLKKTKERERVGKNAQELVQRKFYYQNQKEFISTLLK